jgi:dolichyl-phosphate-mannose--protein O-mannosyl transferase
VGLGQGLTHGIFEEITMIFIYFVLLIIGISSVWFGLKITEEVYRIAVVFAGAILLLMGFILVPSVVQIGVLLLTLGLHQLYTPQKILGRVVTSTEKAASIQPTQISNRTERITHEILG